MKNRQDVMDKTLQYTALSEEGLELIKCMIEVMCINGRPTGDIHEDKFSVEWICMDIPFNAMISFDIKQTTVHRRLHHNVDH
jgi:hypothetical protein